MTCPSCRYENRPDSKFCLECGAGLASGCAHCGAELPPVAKFCDRCGQPRAQPPVAAPPRSFPTKTPAHLADKIRQSRTALEGERKQVTVLFADVKGSMELAEQLDPESFSKIMQRFFQILSEGVERFEGFVDKFTGDGIMALFGAPIAHEDHAQRACYAALHLRDAARAYANEVRARHGVPFAVRIGLNSGEVVVGRIGDDLRMEFTAQGHTVGLAQRMEALAESGHICVSEHTARLVEGYFRLLIELACAGGCYYFEAQAQLALAAALLATDGVVPRAEIESALARAEQLVESIAGRSLSPRILEQRGRLAAAVGDAPAAARALREALDLYRAIGAPGHAERLARELGT